ICGNGSCQFPGVGCQLSSQFTARIPYRKISCERQRTALNWQLTTGNRQLLVRHPHQRPLTKRQVEKCRCGGECQAKADAVVQQERCESAHLVPDEQSGKGFLKLLGEGPVVKL